MDNKDSFLTYGYRGGFVHCCCNRTTGKSEISVQLREGMKSYRVKSPHAAKVRITQYNTKQGLSHA